VIGLAVVVGLSTLMVGVVAAFGVRHLPTVRLQLVGLSLVAVALPLTAVAVSGLLMFHMGADVAVLAVSAAAATGALVGAVTVAGSIVRRLDSVRDASVRLAAGEMTARAPGGGPAELDQLAASFNAMAATLERDLDARRDLVAWASHDLRAPLTSLQAMLEAIEDGVVAPEVYLDALHGQVRLLGALVDDLFELARIDAGVLRLDRAPTDLGAVAADVVARHNAEARARGITLQVAVHDPSTVAWCAPDKMERVLVNLLANALRYTPPDGHVLVSVTTGAGAVLVSIEDSGVGIAPEALDRVFEPFWRADGARTPAEGHAGLGLAIARGLMEAQGGRIWAERPAGGGARVCLMLPSTAEPATEPGDRTGPPSGPSRGGSGAGDGVRRR
jgi:signal transduction histidine kinase